MAERLDNQTFIVRVVVPTLAAVILAVTITLLASLFDDKVDNSEILKVIGPAFLTTVGAFVGFLGGYAVGRNEANKPCKPTTVRPLPAPLPSPRIPDEGEEDAAG